MATNNNSMSLLRSIATTEIHEIEAYLNEKYYFRYNLIKGITEYKIIGDNAFQEIDDYAFNSMLLDLLRHSFSCTDKMLGFILKSDFVKCYDPFKDYFESLSWDGKDYITELANSVQTQNDDNWRKFLKKWIVAVVACALGKAENHTALVLSGGQGIGKTTWLQNLLPKALEEYYYSGTINPHSRDSLVHLTETLLINLDELENLNRIEQGNLKEVITKGRVSIRKVYERFHKKLTRRASFMGSINDNEFLSDITGNRRYLCFKVEDHIQRNNINMDNVYAQAYHIYINGENGQQFQFWFDPKETMELEKNNEEFRRISLEEELIERYFDVPSDTSNAVFMTPSDIIFYISKYEGYAALDKSSLKRIGQVMQKKGFKKKSTQTSKPYRVILREATPKRIFL